MSQRPRPSSRTWTRVTSTGASGAILALLVSAAATAAVVVPMGSKSLDARQDTDAALGSTATTLGRPQNDGTPAGAVASASSVPATGPAPVSSADGPPAVVASDPVDVVTGPPATATDRARDLPPSTSAEPTPTSVAGTVNPTSGSTTTTVPTSPTTEPARVTNTSTSIGTATTTTVSTTSQVSTTVPTSASTTTSSAPTTTTINLNPGINLFVSILPDRSRGVPILDPSRTLMRGSVYIFIGPNAGIATAEFYLDDVRLTGPPRTIDTSAPFDFVGGTAALALPWDTQTVKNGVHTITAVATRNNGPSFRIEATFTVLNAGDDS